MHPAVINSNDFIQQFIKGSFPGDPFLSIPYNAEELEKANTVPLMERIQLIEKLSYCLLIKTSQWPTQQNVSFWMRLLRFFGFCYSVPLPATAKSAHETCKSVMENLSKRQKAYKSLDGDINTRFKYLESAYYRSIDTASGCSQRGQHYIDQNFLDLQDFISYHPEYQSKLPKKVICQKGGGTGAISDTLGTMLNRNY